MSQARAKEPVKTTPRVARDFYADLMRTTQSSRATVLAERIGWPHSMTVLKDRVRAIRPEYRGVDPADRIEHEYSLF